MKQTILGTPPSKSNGYKIGHKMMYKSKALTDYENSFYLQCGMYRDANIDKFFQLELDVYYPSNRSDLDGSLKILLDILQKKVHAIKNDNLCTKITANKFIDKVNPRIEFALIIT
jgi:Holliday junction resolvase RusA-like endonuclease